MENDRPSRSSSRPSGLPLFRSFYVFSRPQPCFAPHIVRYVSCFQEDVADKKPLFDVEEYLRGVLWNLQMYVDGFVPNYYWIYSLRYSPSVADMLVWIQDSNPESLAKVASPVTQAPPLPAAIACMCMIPMSESGRAFLPERLQPLVQPGSPLLQEMNSLDIPKILRIVQEQAPAELRDFHVGSHSR